MDSTDTASTRRATAATRQMYREVDSFGDERISQLPYLPGLDGIRALAVIAVMVYHANSDWLAGGYLGVEVFFVISGYLITLLLIAEHERSGSIDLKNFWIRRFRRLLPALFVMMLLLSVWVALFNRSALGKLRGDVLAGIFYGSNWYQIWIGAGYSAGNDFAPLRHLWSLAVEEQFYLIWPLVMMVLVRVGSRRIAGTARWLFLGAVVVTVAVAVLSHSGPQAAVVYDAAGVGVTETPGAYWSIGGRLISKPDTLYLSTISRAGGLLLGSAFAMIWRPEAIMRGALRQKAAWLDGAAVVGFVVLAALCWYVGFQPAQGVEPLLFRGGFFITGIASLAIIAAVTHQRAITGRLLSLPVLVWIGTRSYGLYLYHWPIYQIIRKIASNKLRFHEFVLAMVATVIITELSYRFVETPIRHGKLSELWNRRRSGERSRSSLSVGQRRGVVGGVAAAVALAVFAVGSMATAELQQNEVQQALDAGKADSCDVLTGANCGDEPVSSVEPAATDPAAVVGDSVAADSVAAAEQPTTLPPTTLPPEPISELALGDSVMLGAAGRLSDLGFTVDAAESRSFARGVEIMQALAEADRLPSEVLVLHLGTNGPIEQSDMDAMMSIVAPIPKVLMLTNSVDRDWTAGNNQLIYAAAEATPNVQLMDWDGFTGTCTGDCFYSDGFHLAADGQTYYAQLVDDFLQL